MDNKLEISNITKKEIINENNSKTYEKADDKKKTGLLSKICSFFNLSETKNDNLKNASSNEVSDVNNKNLKLKTEEELETQPIEKSNNEKSNLKKQIQNQNRDNKKENSFTKFFKIKQVKVAVIVLIFGVAALIILNSSFGTSLTNKNTTKNSSYMTSLEYCEKLENKLMEVLEKISGVGDVKVMVTVESGPEIKIATSTDERTNTTTNGTNSTTNSTTVKDPIIITSSGSNSPLVLSEIVPQVTGVIVVASGAKDVKVRLNLLEAIKVLLNISSSNIQIYY